MLKQKLKDLAKKLPIAFTRNQRYDLWTRQIIRQHCQSDSNCIDVGAHRGEILSLFLKHAPMGRHHAFEPIPEFADFLNIKFGDKTKIHEIALSDTEGSSSFNYVVSNPSYSGLIKRSYDRAVEKDKEITVKTMPLDNLLDPDERIDLVKIDVEGGELLVLKGGKAILRKNRPIIIFEHGKGAADAYNYGPDVLFDFVHDDLGMKISLLKSFLDKKNPLSRKEFIHQYERGENYYFVAHP